MRREASREIIDHLIRLPKPTLEDVNLAKIKAAEKYNLKRVLSNSEIINCLKPNEREKLIPVLKRKAVRTISGVTVIAVMTKPWPCPKSVPCAYCPGGPQVGAPQSYTGHEPAAMRGLQNNFDPYLQVKSRILQLKAIGHPVDKVELIIMGGTFPAMPLDYQERFVRGCLDAINGAASGSLDEAKRISEHSPIRNVGITVETRPDWSREPHVDHMLSMGVTRVELGVQNIYDDIYEIVDRGHTVQDVIDATGILKDSGLKVVMHVMPSLFASYERDLEMFRTLFKDERFKPDAMKIYPTLVLEGTKLYDMWRRGEYNPYSMDKIIDLLVEIKRMVPKWVRIQRIQRDIPSNLIVAGVKASNLRQLVHERLRQKGVRCRCIRCREAGHRMLKEGIMPNPSDIELMITKEKASEGEDVFVSFEDPVNDILIGHLRLRIPSEKAHRLEVSSEPSSIVRELHIYGTMVPVGERKSDAWQHKGYGRRLIAEAERLSVEEYKRRKILVLSALGTKRYYVRLGYRYDGPYVSKILD